MYSIGIKKYDDSDWLPEKIIYTCFLRSAWGKTRRLEHEISLLLDPLSICIVQSVEKAG